jgi:hypothetical protein
LIRTLNNACISAGGGLVLRYGLKKKEKKSPGHAWGSAGAAAGHGQMNRRQTLGLLAL